MSPARTKISMLTVAGPTPPHTTVLAGAKYTRQHANLLMPGQIVSGLVCSKLWINYVSHPDLRANPNG
jgi:hypothetical protein